MVHISEAYSTAAAPEPTIATTVAFYMNWTQHNAQNNKYTTHRHTHTHAQIHTHVCVCATMYKDKGIYSYHATHHISLTDSHNSTNTNNFVIQFKNEDSKYWQSFCAGRYIVLTAATEGNTRLQTCRDFILWSGAQHWPNELERQQVFSRE